MGQKDNKWKVEAQKESELTKKDGKKPFFMLSS